jgi:hypothetical protein
MKRRHKKWHCSGNLEVRRQILVAITALLPNRCGSFDTEVNFVWYVHKQKLQVHKNGYKWKSTVSKAFCV